MMKEIAVYGAGGFGREILWLADSCGGYKVVCIIDDDFKLHGKRKNDIPVIGLGDLTTAYPGASVTVAVGSPKIRQKMTERVQRLGVKIESLIHPRTEMSQSIEVEEGVVICTGCILTTDIRLCKNVQINLGCTIGHDVVLGGYTTLAPGVHVSGWVHFGERVYVGTGAVIIHGTKEKPLTIGDDVVIGAGACVTKSIPDKGIWVGVPAKPVF